MKRVFLFAVAVSVLFISGCYYINGWFLSEEAQSLEGLWYSGGWDSEDSTCYYDFRADGRVFVTEWTDDVELGNSILIPSHFNYSVRNGILKMVQYLGIASFEFIIDDDSSISEGYCHLIVSDYTNDFDFYYIYDEQDFYLYKEMNYSRAAEVRSLYGGEE
ncbi:MAG: hypothetical protein PQJ61_05015 [Spirochaetales bacterium]|uniref:Lipoprotein n=1 Tax=Candidatus Thalassospirochaeta sargassi TaxID=3119039 RepID=A0AAJ1IBA0_9SPIO|nr:hypothetical protein [Spirochaetales bacterium]